MTKVLAASSASVYGLARAFPTPENQDHDAIRTHDGAAKSLSEGRHGPRPDACGVHAEVVEERAVAAEEVDDVCAVHDPA